MSQNDREATQNQGGELSPPLHDAASQPRPVASRLAQPSDIWHPGHPAMQHHVQQSARARKLVNWSHALGWGGLGLLFVGPVAAGIVLGGTAAGVVAVIAAVSVVTGAILGQVGRGMQGRVI